MTARIGLKRESKNITARTGKAEQNRQNRCSYRTGRTVLLGQDSQSKTARTVICHSSDTSPNFGGIAQFCAVFSKSPTKQSM
jgi:hypothetical protein